MFGCFDRFSFVKNRKHPIGPLFDRPGDSNKYGVVLSLNIQRIGLIYGAIYLHILIQIDLNGIQIIECGKIDIDVPFDILVHNVHIDGDPVKGDVISASVFRIFTP